jgi:hypothetical protein
VRFAGDHDAAAIGRSLQILCAMICGLIAIDTSACGGGAVDTEAARTFKGYPLYWVGTHFEHWDLEYVDVGHGEFSSFIYGTCEVSGSDGGCPPPLEIQVQPLCTHLDVVARAPDWQRRRIRAAPVGRNLDGAPVLFTRRVQVKVYRGQGSDPGLPIRAMQALQSANDVEPALSNGELIPAAPRALLSGAAS